MRIDGPVDRVARGGSGGKLEEAFQHQLHPEIVHRTAEKNRHLSAGESLGDVEFLRDPVEEFEFLFGPLVNLRIKRCFDKVVVDPANRERRFEGAVRGAFEEVHLIGFAVEYSAKAGAVTERPVDRHRR